MAYKPLNQSIFKNKLVLSFLYVKNFHRKNAPVQFYIFKQNQKFFWNLYGLNASAYISKITGWNIWTLKSMNQPIKIQDKSP